MSRKTLVFIVIIIAFFIVNITLILNSTKKTIPLENHEQNPLELYFNQEEIDFIADKNIDFEEIKPYLNFKTFNIYNFYIYEKLRFYNSFTHTETINFFNDPTFYDYDEKTKESIFKDSPLVLVNKKFYLGEGYTPKNLLSVEKESLSFIKRDDEELLIEKEVLTQYNKLYNEAFKQGFDLYIFSAYRDYQKQKILFYFVNNEDNLISAKPGHSEHQTGLALDISTLEWGLTEYFQNSNEYKWLINNAHRFGFILRYPKDKESITGYSFEPWHFRYVGLDHAKNIYNNSLTLEEYLFKNFEIN